MQYLHQNNVPIPFELGNSSISGLTLQGKLCVKYCSILGTYKENGVDTKYRFHIMPTITNPSFLITLPNVQSELLSEVKTFNSFVIFQIIYRNGEFERATNLVFEAIHNSPMGCNNIIDGVPPVIVDVGANIGWYSAFSSAAGCRVLSIEPQPRMKTLVNFTWAINERNTMLPKCFYK